MSCPPILNPQPFLSINHWFNHLKVAQKIAFGYAVVVGVAIAGTTLGIILSNNRANQAESLRKHAQYEVALESRLQTSILQVRTHQQQLIPLLQYPEDFRTEYAHIRHHTLGIEKSWADLEEVAADFVEESHLSQSDTALIKFLKTYDGIPDAYLQTVDGLATEIDFNQLKDPGQLQVAQARLLEFTNSDLAIKFDAISDDLVGQIEASREESVEADAESLRANTLRNWAVALSIIASGAIATLLATAISRSITRPLTELEQMAQQVINAQDFSLRSDIFSQDEVGTLATALNQLIEWVEIRTWALEKSRDGLEKTVKERTQELNVIIDSLGDGLLVTNATGKIIRFNPVLLTMVGLTHEHLEGKTCLEVFKEDVTGLVTQNYISPAASLTSEVTLTHERIGQARVTAIAEQGATNQTYLGSVVLIRDITVEKEIDQMKTDFISTVSHELRTPLTSVLGFAKLIQKKLEDVVLPAVTTDSPKIQRTVKQVRENLHIIITEGDRLTSLINDVLDIAKIEAGKVEWDMQPLPISEILDRAIAATAVLAQAAKLQIIRQIEPDLPEVVGDRDRLIQVLINLLSNAIKFTPVGTITCRAHNHQGNIIVSVIDQGIGIALEDQPKVFEKFKQVGEVMTDKPKGTGLGLPICKQIIEHHNGRIWVESQLGQGSSFTFSLPTTVSTQAISIHLDSLVQQLKENVDRAVSSNGSQKNLLVVDDEPHIRELLRQELEAEGYLIRTAQDGIEALRLVEELPPDLIILDVMMPNISGFDLAAVLKNNPATMNIPTIILSIIQDKERGYRLGVDRYLSKPINTELLLSDIKMLLTQEISHKKVLVVDADLSTAKILSDVLVSKGYTVTEATTGSEGIEKALSIKPDMIIINAEASEQHNIVQTLRFDNGLKNVVFVVVQQDCTAPKLAQRVG
ncbi:MAG: response regulator [Timaviella obliquedivisa GSE-PSE-MK23-08B]|jgi:PAS domain S-box-containing protein|nr:response regulator [Timaviella obliquedivisa GSE-PSE-MK23-08B]